MKELILLFLAFAFCLYGMYCFTLRVCRKLYRIRLEMKKEKERREDNGSNHS